MSSGAPGSEQAASPGGNTFQRLAGIIAAVLSLGAAAVHFAVLGDHFAEWWLYGVFFGAVAWLQAVWAIAVIWRPGPWLYRAGAVGNVAVVAMWIVTRTAGVPAGPAAGDVEPLAMADTLASGFETLVALACVVMLVAGAGLLSRRVPWVPFWGVALIALMTAAPATAASLVDWSSRATPARPGPAGAVLHEHWLDAADGTDPGIRLYLREKRPAGTPACGDRAVLFLHPFGVPTAMAFDIPGYSWMDYVAERGFDAWALDIRGFGRSTRPPEMSQAADRNAPVVRATDGVRDVDVAVDYIRRECGAAKVDVVGWSWGAVVAGMYSAEHPGKVGRLVLYGAMHGFDLPWMAQQFEDPAHPGALNPNLPAYQVVGAKALTGHWDKMLGAIMGPGKAEVRSPQALAAAVDVFLASDPAGPKPGMIRRPMGPLVDLYAIWTSRPIYDASRIQAPTLLIRGDHDEFADPTFIGRLTGTSYRREVVVGDATHWLLYEKNRDQLLREVQAFLEADAPAASAAASPAGVTPTSSPAGLPSHQH